MDHVELRIYRNDRLDDSAVFPVHRADLIASLGQHIADTLRLDDKAVIVLRTVKDTFSGSRILFS